MYCEYSSWNPLGRSLTMPRALPVLDHPCSLLLSSMSELPTRSSKSRSRESYGASFTKNESITDLVLRGRDEGLSAGGDSRLAEKTHKRAKRSIQS